MKCNNCQQFGHIAKYCKNKKTCCECSKEYHLTSEKELCTNETNCVNCMQNKMENTKHSSKDKKCPIFIKQKELQAIKTINKVDNKTANKIYIERHHHDGALYTSVANSNRTKTLNKNMPTLTQKSTTVPEFISPETISHQTPSRTLIEYDTITDSESDPLTLAVPTGTTGKQIKILPRRTSKRLQAKFKANEKISNTATRNPKKQTPTNYDEEMDFLSSNDP